MSTDGGFERASIEARGAAFLLGGRFYPSVPDEAVLERFASGAIKPYAVVHYGIIYASPDSRSMMGEEDQPHVMPFSVECIAADAEAARAAAGAVRALYVGWEPSPGSESIVAPGGTSFRDRDSGGAPTRYREVVALETVINVGSNEGYVPTPGGAPGGAALDTIESIVQAYVASLSKTFERHDFPNPVGSWPMEHALGRIPSVTLYGRDGRLLLTDVDATEATALATWGSPTAGFAILT